MKNRHDDATLDDWAVVHRLLPQGWESQAKPLGALRRAREIRDADTLLRVLLIHLADGCSLAETAARAAESDLCRISPVAVLKRLRASEEWLSWICRGLWQARGRQMTSLGRRVRALDATMVSEGGKTGSQWRIHYALNLADLRCDFFELTEQRVGESLARLPVRKGDLILGDRGLSKSPGIASVVRRGGDVLVRTNLRSVRFFDSRGRQQQLLQRLRHLKVGQPTEWAAWIRAPDGRMISGRFIAVRRSARGVVAAQQRARRRAQRSGRTVTENLLQAAAYFTLWTSMPAEELSTRDALHLYRERWQIELAFKRSKSILSLGQLPKHSDASSRAWLHGKLLVALLIERLIDEAERFSPWGYSLEEAAQPLARGAVDGS